MVLALVVPAAFGWNVHALHQGGFPPLAAEWAPRIGWGTPAAVLVAIAAVRWWPALAETVRFRWLLLIGYAVGVAWMVSLATVDGWAGLGSILGRRGEYLRTARSTHDIARTLHHYVERIPADSTGSWPTHIAGHPPGALLFFVLLVAVGAGTGLAAAWVTVLIAASAPVAVLVTLRRLDAEHLARRVAPVLVLGPAAVWAAVSADVMFAAVAAWGLCCTAYGARADGRLRRAAWSIAAGLLLGCCVMLSYGLPLLALLALGICYAARTFRPAPWLAGGAAAVLLGFAAAGFAWWEALPVLRTRYYDGIAAVRPTGYWVWADFAALCFSAGPLVGAGMMMVARRLRLHRGAAERVVVVLSASAALAVVIADLSLMSKAEVERIWLPFVPWLLVSAALLPRRWRTYGLAGQAVLALVVQSLLHTWW